MPDALAPVRDRIARDLARRVPAPSAYERDAIHAAAICATRILDFDNDLQREPSAHAAVTRWPRTCSLFLAFSDRLAELLCDLDTRRVGGTLAEDAYIHTTPRRMALRRAMPRAGHA